MATRTSGFDIRLGVKDLAVVRQALEDVGRGGESALNRIDASAKRVSSGGLRTMTTSTRDLEGGLRGITAQLGPLTAGLAAAFSVNRISGFVKSSIDAVGGLGELSEQLGVTTKALQVYQFAAAQSGISSAELSTSFQFLSKTIGEAAQGQKVALDAFNNLGVGILDSGGRLRPTTAIFRDIADAIQKIDDPAKRAAAAVDLFSRGGQRLLPILSQGSRGLDAYSDAAHRSGVVLDDDVIAAADRASDKMAALSVQVEKLGQSFAVKLAPVLTTVAADLANVIDGPSLSDKIATLRRDIERIGDSGDKLLKLNSLRGIFDAIFGGGAKDVAALRAELDILLELDKLRARLIQPAKPGEGTSNPEDAAAAAKKRADEEKRLNDQREKGLQLSLAQAVQYDKDRENAFVRSAALIKQQDATEKIIADLEREPRLLALSSTERRVQIELAGVLESKGRALSATEKDRVRTAVEQTAAVEAQQRALEAAQRETERRIQVTTDRIVDFGADAFDRILDKGTDAFQALGDEATNIMRRTFAQIIADAPIRPIIL